MSSVTSISGSLPNPRRCSLGFVLLLGMLAWLLPPVWGSTESGISFELKKVSQRAAHGTAQLVFAFRFKNTSDMHLAVEQIEQDCGCLKGKALFESVEPGAAGEIQGVMDLKGLHGTVAKSMWLRFTNGERHELVAEAVIPATLVIDPMDLVWKRGGEAAEQQVVIRVESGPPLEITGVASNLPQFSVRTETVEPGRHYILHVRPESTDKDQAAVIQVQTSSKDPRDAIRAVFASISQRGKRAS